MPVQIQTKIENVMQDHLARFVRSEEEKEIPDYISSDLRVQTPIAEFRGPKGLHRFYEILREYIPQATISITSLDFQSDKVIYGWTASGPTASVRNGRCSVHFQNGKMTEHCIECWVEPDVQNQG